MTEWLSDPSDRSDWSDPSDPNDQVTKWPSDRVTKWPSDQVTEWLSDRVAGSFADDWPYGIFSYVGCLCLPQAVNYWYKVLELLSMTIWFFLYFIICQATLPSRSTLSRMTSKIEVRELLVGKLKSETPQPRVSSPDQSWSYDLRCFKRNLHVSLWFD